MNRKQRLVMLIALLLAVLTSLPIIRADMFAKPTMTVTILGVAEPYYFDLLVYREGEAEVMSDSHVDERIGGFYYRDDYPESLNGFKDEDGYVSYQLYWGSPTHIHLVSSETMMQVFRVGYFSPPSRFKIVIYTEAGVMLTSKIMDRRLFNSEMTFDLRGVDLSASQVGVGTLAESIPYARIAGEFILRLAVTVLLEVGILWLFGYRCRRSYALVGLVNLLTQALLTAAVLMGDYLFGEIVGAIIILILGEFVVFLAEMTVYGLWLREKRIRTAVLYGFAANLVSLFASFFLLLLN